MIFPLALWLLCLSYAFIASSIVYGQSPTRSIVAVAEEILALSNISTLGTARYSTAQNIWRQDHFWPRLLGGCNAATRMRSGI